MPKLTKKLISEYTKTSDSIKRSKRKHGKIVDEILKNKLIQTKLKGKYDNCPGRWKVIGVEFCDDSYMDDTPLKYEWVKISEDEYNKLMKQENINLYGCENVWNKTKESNLKEDYIFEPEFKIVYYQKREKTYKYLRVYVEETWRYGGYDSTHVDFLITDILEEKDLRK